MLLKSIIWLVVKLSKQSELLKILVFNLDRGEQKNLVIKVLKDIVESKDSSIDNKTAEQVITLSVKSVGNKVVSFIIKD